MEEIKTSQKNNSPWVIAGGIVLAAAILAGAYVYSLGAKSISKNGNSTQEDPITAKGLQKGSAPLKGSPNAPATIVEFGDFQCVACVQYFSAIEPEIYKRFIETGQANGVFKTLTFIDSYAGKNGAGESYLAGLAGQCAADQGKFWQIHDAIYGAEAKELQSQKEQENSGNLTKEFIFSVARDNGIDMKQFSACIDGEKHRGTLEGYMNDAQKAMGRQIATPSVFIVKDGIATKLQNPFDIKEYEAIINTN